MITGFHGFKLAVQKQFNAMKSHSLYRTKTDRTTIWEVYLAGFPEGTNPLYKVRTEHDCNCCKSFIRTVGNMVSIIDGKVVSIWDIKVDDFYQNVADALSRYVKSQPIDKMFLHYESSVGKDTNYQETEEGILTWEHFCIQLPSNLIVRKDMIGTELSQIESANAVMFRALKEITMDSLDTVLELIAQNSLPRGLEHKFEVEEFYALKQKFDQCVTLEDQNIFCWSKANNVAGSVAKIRSNVIGTLLIDLSNGKDLEQAVGAYEYKVAGPNYKRPTALASKAMIERAKKDLTEQGLMPSLDRRDAVIEDISVNNVLFADRDARKLMDDVFDEIASDVPSNVKQLKKVEEITIENFIANILPTAKSVEVMIENKHMSNMVSLIAPVDLTAKPLFKWNNLFSWSYAGEMADSIKERVKKAGGNVTGELCCRLAWYNDDDLDFHMVEADRNTIYYGCKRKRSACGGMLDVDANGGDGIRPNPCENIFYQRIKDMKPGTYQLLVHQYQQRKTTNSGFEVEIDVLGTIHQFVHSKRMKTHEKIAIADINKSQDGVITVVPILDGIQPSKDIWGLKTQTFQKANVIMLSPNYWDNNDVGNKHYFFMLEGCIREGSARGFYNEFLKSDLEVHRKSMEMVSSKKKVDDSPNQLSGLGFSSTQRNSVLCRVKGSFTRTVKVIF